MASEDALTAVSDARPWAIGRTAASCGVGQAEASDTYDPAIAR